MIVSFDSHAHIRQGCATAALVLLLLLFLVVWWVRRRRQQQLQPQQQPLLPERRHGLGIENASVAANRRRYHSITVISESQPLLMENGIDFFGPPRHPRPLHKKRRPKNDSNPASDAADPHRRVLTAPSAAFAPSILQTLAASTKQQ
ncbi:hypothetical protein COEREDRAFT_6392 [Coemansia reversa NRRL 1564]|uniref:Uncharacterized protein n=1 Tax=Coemansia reversa (strain ATCC 12441 / NRRL 1564) TaxID=763665 RepID=A0A2G5BI33_COERN|nr:hypothetical protein COEREDRAFT_6392 [Coemansia reversa NRRL 1564]|eukprot:PIA18684.1 hypothetical protein COEREDRAFT_6392 [Coemansia reversa NRRL 1564]